MDSLLWYQTAAYRKSDFFPLLINSYMIKTDSFQNFIGIGLPFATSIKPEVMADSINYMSNVRGMSH